MSSMVGTSYYVAPEVLRREYDGSCDLWSAGVIAYVLLCGKYPFNGDTDEEVHDAVLRGEYTFPSREWSGVSPEALEFICRLLQTDPRKRMSAKEALDHSWIIKHADAGAKKGASKNGEAAAEESRTRDRSGTGGDARSFVRGLLKGAPAPFRELLRTPTVAEDLDRPPSGKLLVL